MTSQQFEDIKYLIESSVMQSEERLTIRIISAVAELRDEMRAGFAAILDITDRHNDELDNHDKRIRRLESSAVK